MLPPGRASARRERARAAWRAATVGVDAAFPPIRVPPQPRRRKHFTNFHGVERKVPAGSEWPRHIFWEASRPRRSRRATKGRGRLVGLRLASPPQENCLLNHPFRRPVASLTLALLLCCGAAFAGLTRKHKASPPPPAPPALHASVQLEDKKLKIIGWKGPKVA